jgi:hypothetical protein
MTNHTNESYTMTHEATGTPPEVAPSFALNDYAIAPEDAGLAKEIEDFDPVADTQGNASFSDATLSRLPSTCKATSLPPHLRSDIEGKLRGVPEDQREAQESRLVAEVLRDIALQSRVKSGLSSSANAFQREVFDIAGESQQLETEAWTIQSKLIEVQRWDPLYDNNGRQVGSKPVELVQGDPRQQLEARLRDIEAHLADLNGRAGQRRLAKAKFEAVQQMKAQRQQVSELAQARELGATMASQERVQRMAEGFAKRHRHSVD